MLTTTPRRLTGSLLYQWWRYNAIIRIKKNRHPSVIDGSHIAAQRISSMAMDLVAIKVNSRHGCLNHVAALFYGFWHSRITIPRANIKAALVIDMQQPIVVIWTGFIRDTPNRFPIEVRIVVFDDTVAIVARHMGPCIIRHESNPVVVIIAWLLKLLDLIMKTVLHEDARIIFEHFVDDDFTFVDR